MYLSAGATTWPQAVVFLGILAVIVFLVGATVAALLEIRKTKLLARQDEDLRQLVRRYEQLAENTLDTQQRIAADMSDLRTRATSIEKILRTVE
jgi:hypothetical protein